MNQETTIFDQIIDRSIPADIVYEDDDVLGFRDINPQAPVHVLFIPKQRIPTHNDVDPDNVQLLAKMHLAAAQYARQINEHENGYRLVINCNKNAQQTVFHIHMHLLAGRTLQWPPG